MEYLRAVVGGFRAGSSPIGGRRRFAVRVIVVVVMQLAACHHHFVRIAVRLRRNLAGQSVQAVQHLHEPFVCGLAAQAYLHLSHLAQAAVPLRPIKGVVIAAANNTHTYTLIHWKGKPR